MEEIDVKGLVIREVKTGEADKLLTILTAEYGKIYVSGKGVKSLKSRHMPSTQLFSYSSFVLRKTKKYFYIVDSDLIECFFGIRYDINKLSLANYICDAVCYLALEGVGDEELLRLTLNTLYALSNKSLFPLTQIKAAFEIKAAAVSGFMPTLDCCGICGNENLSGGVYLDIMNGRLLCEKCHLSAASVRDVEGVEGTAFICRKINISVLDALRFTTESSVQKFLSFTLEKEDLELYSDVCEQYLISHIEHSFKSLDYYKSIMRDE